MATKPTKKPRWATNDVINGVSGQTNVIEPSESKKDLGHDFDESPFRQYMNWLDRITFLWVDWFDQEIDSNTSNISTNTDSISSNSSAIGVNAGNISTNAGNISNNSSAIGVNAGNISTNAGNISSNGSGIGVNAGNILVNESNIATNSMGIGVISGNVTTNTGNISSNISAIGVNSSNISSNASGIVFEAGRITTNVNSIANNTTAIGVSASNISSNASAIGVNTGNISTNTSEITLIESNLYKTVNYFKYRTGSFSYTSSNPAITKTGWWARMGDLCFLNLSQFIGSISGAIPLISIIITKSGGGNWANQMLPFEPTSYFSVIARNDGNTKFGKLSMTSNSFTLIAPGELFSGNAGLDAITLTYKALNAI